MPTHSRCHRGGPLSGTVRARGWSLELRSSKRESKTGQRHSGSWHHQTPSSSAPLPSQCPRQCQQWDSRTGPATYSGALHRRRGGDLHSSGLAPHAAGRRGCVRTRACGRGRPPRRVPRCSWGNYTEPLHQSAMNHSVLQSQAPQPWDTSRDVNLFSQRLFRKGFRFECSETAAESEHAGLLSTGMTAHYCFYFNAAGSAGTSSVPRTFQGPCPGLWGGQGPRRRGRW